MAALPMAEAPTNEPPDQAPHHLVPSDLAQGDELQREEFEATPAQPERDRIDERLLIASRSGDREAFRTLMERHRDDVLRFLVRFLGSRTAADDVFQDTFLQVHLAADTFDAERRFRPWLFAIAANKARDYHRRHKRRATTSLSTPVGQGDASLIELLKAENAAPDSPTERNEIQGAVKRVVDEMPTHYREILLLAYFQRMSYQQIAECLAIPLGTVKSRLHAAVANFAASWKATQTGREDHFSRDRTNDREAHGE
ncbi:MAG: RNA polymerase sigma factor [Phycisphaerae bacterium]|nr:RNA polymerase sigma factor [Phycisphaerae bacterium]